MMMMMMIYILAFPVDNGRRWLLALPARGIGVGFAGYTATTHTPANEAAHDKTWWRPYIGIY